MTPEMTPEMIAVLRAELQADPAGRGYAGKTPAEAADLLNESYIATGPTPAPILRDIASSDVHKIIVPTGELFKISRLAALPLDGTQDVAIGAAWSFSEMLTRWATIETSNAGTWAAAQTSMAALQNAGVLSAGSIAAVVALVEVTPSAPVTEHHARIMEIFIQNPVEFPADFTRYAATAADVQEALS